jgi:pyruvate kinase
VKRRAKIVATIGPASRSLDTLRLLADAGMDGARLNFSHGEPADHAEVIERLRQVAREKGRPIAILQDLAGPKVRTRPNDPPGPIHLEPGQMILLSPSECPSSTRCISIDYPALTTDLPAGSTVLIDDGRIQLLVVGTTPDALQAEVVVGGALTDRKGVNFPGAHLALPALTPKDLQDLEMGLEHGVDAIAASFVRHEDNVRALRQAADRSPHETKPLIWSKIERPEALERLDHILESSDGVMVARGDLGVEMAPERVPSIQKRIIREGNAEFKLVMTATQMLDSMIHNPRPTRAEASDVANAVFDGSDALMLSGETALGDYPVETVRTMAQIILDAEAHVAEWGSRASPDQISHADDATATVLAARELAQERGAAALAVFTRSGQTARLMSKARPRVPILAFTSDPRVVHQMALFWGTEPHLVPLASTVEEMIASVEAALRSHPDIGDGAQVVMVASLPIGAMGPANFTYLHTIGAPR